MNRYALVENGLVINTIIWDGKSEWSPGDGVTVIQLDDSDAVSIGDSYDGSKFILRDIVEPTEAA